MAAVTKTEESGDVVDNTTASSAFSEEKEATWLTRNEGLMWIRAWREIYIPKRIRDWAPWKGKKLDFGPKSRKTVTSGVAWVWMNGLADELEERIAKGADDPVSEVAAYLDEMDEVLALSDESHYVTHRYAAFMWDAAHDALWYLMRKEQTRNERSGRDWT